MNKYQKAIVRETKAFIHYLILYNMDWNDSFAYMRNQIRALNAEDDANDNSLDFINKLTKIYKYGCEC